MFSDSFKKINNKNSQELISYLQKRKSPYNPILRNLISKEDEKIIFDQEDLPPSRMCQFYNKNDKTTKQINNKNFNKSSENKTNITKINSTQKFNNVNVVFKTPLKENKINKNSKTNDSSCSKRNYLDFDLHENIYQGELLHLYLPKKYKDDEHYKSNLYKFLKTEVKNEFNYKSKITKLKEKTRNKNYLLEFLPKSKKLYSVKIKNNRKITYYDMKNKIYSFSLFRDNMIGFDKKWQESIIIRDYDNDTESDNEQIKKGKEKMIKEVKRGIIQWAKNKKLCYNYKYTYTKKEEVNNMNKINIIN